MRWLDCTVQARPLLPGQESEAQTQQCLRRILMSLSIQVGFLVLLASCVNRCASLIAKSEMSTQSSQDIVSVVLTKWPSHEHVQYIASAFKPFSKLHAPQQGSVCSQSDLSKHVCASASLTLFCPWKSESFRPFLQKAVWITPPWSQPRQTPAAERCCLIWVCR